MMPTHQELGGMSDNDLLQRMVTSHTERYNETFWEFYRTQVYARVPEKPIVMDLGCGPGLFLRDVATRFTPSALYGYDLTPAMIEHAKSLGYNGVQPTLAVHNLMAAPLPVATGSIHVVNMTAVLHVLDNPLAVLEEIRRVLMPGGIFFLNDWVRAPLQTYLASRIDQTVSPDVSLGRLFRLFPAHNKYTLDDWHWLLTASGFLCQSSAQLRPHFQVFVTTPLR
jgi:SAM-dependent methyltransferase